MFPRADICALKLLRISLPFDENLDFAADKTFGNLHGDLVLCSGTLEAAVLLPSGNAWQPEGCVSIMVGGSWRTPRRAALTAVRRTDGQVRDA